jgi:tetratricopeptide (TPR) repeat protein
MPAARRWLFRLAAVFLGPLLVLVLLEVVLRLAGVGHPMSFFLPMKINGRDCFVENDRFGWRFFGPAMARAPFPFVIPKVKAPGTVRVFVFGESAAYGDPQPEFGLPRLLQALLEARYPDKHFEVVNTAMTAINSHVILPIAKDSAAREGDFWVVYMGNNEVVGPYGAGTVFGTKAAKLTVVRAAVALKATRLGQLLGTLARNTEKTPLDQSEWGGMRMFVRNHVRSDDSAMATVYDNFTRNLIDIVGIGTRNGATVLIGTIARNLKDCAPFASDHRPGLPNADLAEWEHLYALGTNAQQSSDFSVAADAFEKADKIDDSFAEEHFHLGQCFLALGQDREAAPQFTLACDDDTLRFRADSRINQIIRRVASDRDKQKVQLVDSEALLEDQSPHGLTGNEFLYEHVHLNFEGNYLIARGFAERIGMLLSEPSERPWLSEDECARRLGWNDFTRCAGDKEILSRLSDPPFNQQSSNPQQVRHLISEIEKLSGSASVESLRRNAALTRDAAVLHPDDWILQENLAQAQQQIGDVAGAINSLKGVVRLLPQSADAWQCLGMALSAAKQNDEAAAAFQKASEISPESVVSLNSLAELYARENRANDAARAYREVLRRKPYWGPAHLGLGKILDGMGKTQEANSEYKEAFKNRVRTPASFNALAAFAFSKGWYDIAMTNYTDSLRLYPSDPEIHVNLGLTLGKLDRHAEASAQFAEAIRLQPQFAEAHFCLGLEQGRQGDTAGAAAQFAEAVRLKPSLLEAHLNLGIAYANQHRNQEALEQFNEVLQRDPANLAARKFAAILTTHPTGRSNN